jgi:hypothetical protein
VQAIVVMVVATFLIGGTAVGRRIRTNPVLLGAACVVAAGSFYSLRVVT